MVQKRSSNKGKIRQIVQKAVKEIIIILSICIISFLFLQSMYGSALIDNKEHILFQRDSILANLMVILAVILVGILLKRYKVIPMPTDKFLHVVTAIYIIMMLMFVLCLQVNPTADQRKVLNATYKFIAGDYTEWGQGAYCYIFPNQNGIVLIFSGLIKILGEENWISIQIMNILALLLCAVYGAKIIFLLFENKKYARYAYIGMLFFIPLNCYVTFVYGTLFGLAAALTGLYLLIKYFKDGKLIKGIFGMFLVVFAYCCKSNYLIFWVAMLLLLLYDSIVEKRIKSIGIFLNGILLYTAVSCGITFYVEKITGMELGTGIPQTAWVAMGLQEGSRGPGWYNGYNNGVFEANQYDFESTKASIQENIFERIAYFEENKGYALDFFGRKIASQWNEGTFQGFWINNVEDTRREIVWSEFTKNLMEDNRLLNSIMVGSLNWFLSFLWLGVLSFLILCKKEIDTYQLMFCILFLGGFVFHLIWEAKGQYTVVYVYLLIPYMIKGYQRLLQKSDILIKFIDKKK